MRNSVWLVPGIIISLSISTPADAKLYKWVDDKGITHYGETIPPEYAGSKKETLTKSGLIEKKPEKADETSVKAKQEADVQKKREQEAELEVKRRNATLLNTYSNEKEIDQARDRSLVLINARVDSNKMLLQSAQNSLEDLHKEADSRTKAGKKIPVSLTNDITQTEARIKRYQDEMAKNENEMQEIKERYGKEKELYRQLKGAGSKK